LIIAHKFEAELTFVEFSGLSGVFGGNESYEFAGSKLLKSQGKTITRRDQFRLPASYVRNE
jgi:hypothetical protein